MRSQVAASVEYFEVVLAVDCRHTLSRVMSRFVPVRRRKQELVAGSVFAADFVVVGRPSVVTGRGVAVQDSCGSLYVFEFLFCLISLNYTSSAPNYQIARDKDLNPDLSV